MAVSLSAHSAQTDTRGIHAVPAPKRVTINGKLDDWDLSGQVLMCYDVKSLKDVYSGRVAMMHDADNLYVSIDWKDPIPLGNSHDPQFQANRGWAGDSVQLRFKTDRISHVTAWCYARKTEPCIQISYGKSLTQPFGGGDAMLYRKDGWKMDKGVEMAFANHEDGKGYVQEIKLPWSVITKGGRKALGKKFSCGVELLWGEADWPVHRYADNLAPGETSREFFWTAHKAWGPVFIEKKGKLKLPKPAWQKALDLGKLEGPVEINYVLPKKQRVTIAIDDGNGRRVRNLLASAERKAGKNVDLWDCLDDAGKLVAPGRYTIKGLHHDGLHVDYEGSFASPANPPWNTSENKGSYYGDHTPPEAAAFGPGKLGALACSMGEAGRHLIGVDLKGRRQWGVANRIAFGGGRIRLATDGKLLWVGNVDGRNGSYTIWRCDLKTSEYRPWKRKDANGKAILDLSIASKNGMNQCSAIAVHKSTLAVTLVVDRKILLLDAETGDIRKELANMPARMGGMAYRKDGQLLLTAGTKMYVVSPTTAKVKELASGLTGAYGLAVDAKGQIYVSQWSKAMNVVVFDSKGQVIRTIGKKGGRPAKGFFNEKGMLRPGQIAVDSTGKLWVPEMDQQPKRTSVWTADGELAFDLVGTTAYCAGGQINPYDHRRAFSEQTEYRYDEKRKEWRPFFTLGDALGTGHSWVTRFARVNGHEYMQMRSTARDCGMVKIFIRRPDGGWRHCAEFGNAGRGKNPDVKYHAQWNRKFTGPLWKGRFGKVFCWVDSNDNGKAEFDEIQTVSGSVGGFYWGQAMGRDLTVVLPSKGTFWRLKPEKFTAKGTPIYSLKKRSKISVNYGGNGEGMVMVGHDGRFYVNASPLCAIDKNGKTLWTYPSPYLSVHGSHKAPAARPGLLIGPSSIYGTAMVNDEIGEVFLLNGNLGQNFIFTEDGLWVQSLWNDCRGWFDIPTQATIGMPCDAMTAGGESFGGWFCKTEDGKYHVVGGGTAAISFELTGMDSMKRFSSTVEVGNVHLVAAEELRVRRAARTLADKVCSVKSVDKTPALNGDLTSWDMKNDSVEIAGGAGVVGQAKAFYDKNKLYLAWEVKDRTAMRNSGQDDRLMFITGDCVDLMLRTSRSKSQKPVAGDLRLLLTMKSGKPIAVLYQPVAPGADKKEAQKLSSPWRSVHFDRIKTVEIELGMKKIRGGYAVTAAVPLSMIGIDTLKGKTLQGDFGILLSDSAGQECTSRNYWSNKAANNTNDVPDEAILTPTLWATLRFE